MQKPKIVKDYEKLAPEIVEQIKLVYPRGFAQHLIPFVNREGERRMGLPFETEDRYYLIRMSKAKAEDIVENDDDFDDEGNLRKGIKNQYEEKYEDNDFLDELNANDDNDFGDDDDNESDNF